MSKHGIRVITSKTGLSPHVIRIWERRYNAVSPQRSASNRRLYTDDDLKRLTLLAELTNYGHTIGQIAKLSTEELKNLHQSLLKHALSSEILSIEQRECKAIINSALIHIANFDEISLKQTLDKAAKHTGFSGLLERVIAPLMIAAGEAWNCGSLTSAQEHAASSFIKDYLCRLSTSFSFEENAPTVIVTTPTNQLHELGAIIAANQARIVGWKVIYLGPSLPSDEIASAVEKTGASALILSIIYPTDDPHLPSQLVRLRMQLRDTPIIVGGSGASSYHHCLKSIKAIRANDVQALSLSLDQIRNNILKKQPHTPPTKESN